MHVSELPVPRQVSKVLEEKGVSTLYPPQEEALTRTRVLRGGSLLLATPTASGKTLVAEVCSLKKSFESGGKILYLTPLRALAYEKYTEFKVYEDLTRRFGWSIRVALSMGDYDSSDPWLSRYDWIITTNEKCDSLIRHEAPWLRDVALIVADEIHYINDPYRGPTLEMLLTKIKHLKPETQILALSATVRNAEEIAGWLDAEYVVSEWRPVKLREGVIYDHRMIYGDGETRRIEEKAGNPLFDLTVETVKGGGQILVFTNTRRRAVETARKLSRVVSKILEPEDRAKLIPVAKAVEEVGESRIPLSETLAELIRRGTAFHHAGLHNEHRALVEDAFRRGFIKALTATPTLAAGVNLPARVVVVSSYYRFESGFGYSEIPVMEYKQMAGRAGRPKYDVEGYALLAARDEDEAEFLLERYVRAEPESLRSKLGAEGALRSHVLATIASKFASTEESIYKLFGRTFFAYQFNVENLKPYLNRIIGFLVDHGMVEEYDGKLEATKLGRRVAELYVDPLTAVVLEECLARIEKPTDLALLYAVCSTPDLEPKFYPSRREAKRLEAVLDLKAGEIPLEESWYTSFNYVETLARLKTALILEAWIEEETEQNIYERFRVEPGDLFRLVSTATWLLYASSELAPLLGYPELGGKLKILEERVEAGVKPELLPLVRLEGVGRVRARSLFKAGYKTLEDLASARIEDLTRIPSIGSRIARSILEQVRSLEKTG